MNFKTCRQLIYEDFHKVLTQQPMGKLSEYLYILRYLITNNSFKFCFWFRLGSWSKGNSHLYVFMDNASALYVQIRNSNAIRYTSQRRIKF